jgi:hypothetical protein
VQNVWGAGGWLGMGGVDTSTLPIAHIHVICYFFQILTITVSPFMENLSTLSLSIFFYELGSPGSLISNKNLGSGEQCGRVAFRMCAQPEEREKPCNIRNVVYESECSK